MTASLRRLALPALRAAGAACLAAGLAGCVGAGFGTDDVTVVRDLSGVAGCRFMGTVTPPPVTPPPVTPGLRDPAAHDAYKAELRRRAASRGGTHLYLMNESAGWGAAQTLGTAYRCER